MLYLDSSFLTFLNFDIFLSQSQVKLFVYVFIHNYTVKFLYKISKEKHIYKEESKGAEKWAEF